MRTLRINKNPVTNRDIEFRAVAGQREALLAALMRNFDASAMHIQDPGGHQLAVDIELRLEERTPAEAI